MSTKHGVLVDCDLQGVTYKRLVEIMSKEGWKFDEPVYTFGSEGSASGNRGDNIAFLTLGSYGLVTSLGILNPK